MHPHFRHLEREIPFSNSDVHFFIEFTFKAINYLLMVFTYTTRTILIITSSNVVRLEEFEKSRLQEGSERERSSVSYTYESVEVQI
jgi:hypothetical protein